MAYHPALLHQHLGDRGRQPDLHREYSQGYVGETISKEEKEKETSEFSLELRPSCYILTCGFQDMYLDTLRIFLFSRYLLQKYFGF